MKVFKRFVGGICALVVASSGAYAFFMERIATVALNKTFYFLTSDFSHAEAAVSTIYSDGGKGYLLEHLGETYAVFACYMDESSALETTNTMKETTLERVYVEKIYFKNATEKRDKEKIIGILSSLESCIRLLTEYADGLKEGIYTQSETREVVHAVEKVVCGLHMENNCSDSVEVLETAIEMLSEMDGGILFAKEVRNVSLILSDCYLRVCNRYAL